MTNQTQTKAAAAKKPTAAQRKAAAAKAEARKALAAAKAADREAAALAAGNAKAKAKAAAAASRKAEARRNAKAAPAKPAKPLAAPKGDRDVVTNKRSAKAQRDAATKALQPTAVQPTADAVPGHPMVPLYRLPDGKLANSSTIAGLRTLDDDRVMAVCNDGGMYPVAKYEEAGIAVQPGMTMRDLTDAYVALTKKAHAARSEAVAQRGKPKAQLARGIAAGAAPQSAKAVADQTAKPKAAAKTAKPKAAAKTAKPAAAAAPKPAADRKYAKGPTAIAARPGTWRHHMLTTIQAHKSTAAAAAAQAKVTGEFAGKALDFRWANAEGYIVLAK